MPVPAPAAPLPPDTPDTRQVLRSWAAAELAPWLPPRPSGGTSAPSIDPASVERTAAALNARDPWVFVYDFQDGIVSARPKPWHYTEAETADGRLPYIGRMLHYRHFFSEVSRQIAIPGRWSLILDASDGGLGDCDVPLFAFQKTRNSRKVLLPDPEFFYMQYYEAAEYTDTTPYSQKLRKAVFAGSTTGGGLLTVDAVHALAAPRLRSGVAFRDVEDVDFRLPAIVQCVDAAAEQAVRALGFGGPPIGWAEQLRYRFLISIDGNGAACSRLAIGLKSNSVVLKYASDSLLFYFHGLRPWEHYIPIGDDREVLDAIAIDRSGLTRCSDVAQGSARFYRDYLAKDRLLEYTGLLLSAYASAVQPG